MSQVNTAISILVDAEATEVGFLISTATDDPKVASYFLDEDGQARRRAFEWTGTTWVDRDASRVWFFFSTEAHPGFWAARDGEGKLLVKDEPWR